MRLATACLLGGMASQAVVNQAWADRLTLPQPAFERAGHVSAVYHFDAPPPQATILTLEWTDSLGRLVTRVQRQIAAGQTEARLEIDLGLAVAMRNHLRAQLATGAQAETDFIARPPPDEWSDFETLIWHDKTPEQAKILRGTGLTGAKVFGFRGTIDAAELQNRLATPLAADLRVFVENIATDFYAPYHRWTQEHPDNVIWLFEEAKRAHAADPDSLAPFMRTPSLSDLAWIARIQARMAEHASAFGAYRPFYYSLGDETGIADLTAAWDFDFSPASLAAFRRWLQSQYGTIDALNAEWETGFTRWEAVMPSTTTAAMARPGENFAAWLDFKTWMDEAFARAVQAGTTALHQADPTARSAIEGAQMPGTGGYDYTRIAGAVDVMEFSDLTTALPLALSLNPTLIGLTTISGSGPEESATLWQAALAGSRGAVIWDEAGIFFRPNGRPSAPARADGEALAELRSDLGTLLIASPPATDGVAILTSPASEHIAWLRNRRAAGIAWTQRRSETELEDNAQRRATREAADLLRALGVNPNFVASPARLRDDAVRVLIMPRILALSAKDAADIANFVAEGGTVLADLPPGRFNQHGRRQAATALATLALPPIPTDLHGMAEQLALAGIAPMVRVTRPDGSWADDVALHVRRNGGVALLGLQRTPPGGVAKDYDLWWSDTAFVRDLRTGDALQATDRLRIRLDPFTPTLLALAPAALPGPELSAPAQAQLGSVVEISVGLAATGAAAAQVMRIEAIDPNGKTATHHAANLVLRHGPAHWRLILALNDPKGSWTIRAHDRLSGRTVTLPIEVTAP